MDIVEEVAGELWDWRRANMGITERSPFLMKSWFEVNTLANSGDNYHQFIRSSHIENVREVLEANKRVIAKKIAHSLENDVDAAED